MTKHDALPAPGSMIRARDRAACLAAFQNNNYFGAAIFAGILLQYATRG